LKRDSDKELFVRKGGNTVRTKLAAFFLPKRNGIPVAPILGM